MPIDRISLNISKEFRSTFRIIWRATHHFEQNSAEKPSILWARTLGESEGQSRGRQMRAEPGGSTGESPEVGRSERIDGEIGASTRITESGKSASRPAEARRRNAQRGRRKGGDRGQSGGHVEGCALRAMSWTEMAIRILSNPMEPPDRRIEENWKRRRHTSPGAPPSTRGNGPSQSTVGRMVTERTDR